MTAGPVPTPGSLESAEVPDQPAFCKHCGNAIDPMAAQCVACQDVVVPPPTPIAAASELSLKPTLTLYFLLLASFIPLAFTPEHRLETVGLMVQAFDAVLVLGWLWATRETCTGYLNLKTRPHWYAMAGGLGIATFGVAVLLTYFTSRAFGIESYRYVQPYFDEGYGWAIVILSVVVQPAVIEELAFRGLILDGLRGMMTVTEAVVVSALMFMVIHLTLLSLPHLLLLGLLLGWLRLACGSIWPCVLLHATHNGLVVASEHFWGL